MNILCWLSEWYQSNCDGGKEHESRIEIGSLDNPGWYVDINLINTPLEDKAFTKINIDKSDDDWFICRVENNVYKADGDPLKLEVILTIFKDWVEKGDTDVS